VLTLRFDMRAPSFGASTTELYGAAIDMCAWAEGRGAAIVVLSEHHGADDNRHRTEEYEHFGLDVRRRAELADRNLALVRGLLAGGVGEGDGRPVRVTPPPASPGGPTLMIGGGSVAAAERAGRNGLALVAQADAPGMREAYEAACRAHGYEPVPGIYPGPDAPTAVFVADDVDRAWAELGPHLLHDATTAASYRHGQDGVASISRARTVDELRAGGPYRVITVADAVALVRSRGSLPLAPLCGGLPPERAWPYLERAAEAVARASASG
jgi:hypothetical protein